MFNGTVNFIAKIRGNGITFEPFTFNPNKKGVDKLEIEAPKPKGDLIKSRVYLVSVETEKEGEALAAEVNDWTLNRIAFAFDIVVEKATNTDCQFVPVKSQQGKLAIVSTERCLSIEAVQAVIGIPVGDLKKQLENESQPGEGYYSFFRFARQSESPVEEFMYLYHILSMLFNDSQPEVDAFILQKDPKVLKTPSPKFKNREETVYTRLRNELAHQRQGVNLDDTKAEMKNQLGGLIKLTKRAIEQSCYST